MVVGYGTYGTHETHRSYESHGSHRSHDNHRSPEARVKVGEGWVWCGGGSSGGVERGAWVRVDGFRHRAFRQIFTLVPWLQVAACTRRRNPSTTSTSSGSATASVCVSSSRSSSPVCRSASSSRSSPIRT